MEYKTERSSRKTLALLIKDGGLIVRAPLKTSDEDISAFVARHKRWIEERLKKAEEMKEKLAGEEPLTRAEIEELAKRALAVIPERVRYYAEEAGVTYGKITIRNQRSKWGSCSAAGNS